MSLVLNETVVDASSASAGTKWWHQIEDIESVVVVKDNGTTSFFKITGGTPLGKITASGKYRPCTKGTLTAGSAASTTVTLGAGVGLFRVGDVVDVIQASDGATLNDDITVNSIDTGAGTMVVSAAVTAAIGDYIQGNDGSQTCVGILEESIQTADGTDADGVQLHYDQGARMVTRGVANESQLVAFNSVIKADLSGHFTFR